MWLSQMLAAAPEKTDAPEPGVVSIGGDDPAVQTETERRTARVLAPGGYSWSPCVGDQTVLLGGRETVLAGLLAAAPVALSPGDVCIHAGSARIVVRTDGTIELNGPTSIYGNLYIHGDAYINGERWEKCKCT